MSSLRQPQPTAEAAELGLALLRKLGIDVPEAGAFGARVAQRLDAFYTWVEALGPPAAARPLEAETNDQSVRAAAKGRSAWLLTPGLFADPNVRSWLTLESQRLWATLGCARRCRPTLARRWR